jgi:hypothetical protein
MPIYQVAAVEDGRVVLTGEDDAPAPSVPLEALRWRARGG